MIHNDFTYKELFAFGWEKTKKHFWFLLGIFAIAVVLNILTNKIPFISTVVSLLTSIAIVSVLLDIVHGHTPVYKDLLKPFQNYKITWHYFLGTLLLLAGFAVVLGIGALILIPILTIPAYLPVGFILIFVLICALIYAAVRLQFFRYFIIEDENLGPINALKKSMAITHGRFWKLFGFLCLIALLNLVGLILILVGLLVTIPVSLIAYTHLYKKLVPSHTHEESHGHIA